MKTCTRFAMAALLIVALAACGGGGGEGPQYDDNGNLIVPSTPAPPDGPYCAFPNGHNPTLVSPVPGTVLSVGPTGVTISDTSTAPYFQNVYGVEFANTNSRQDLENNPITHSIIVSEFLSPVASVPGEVAASLYPAQTFLPHQTYYAYLYWAGSQCNANGPFGSFQTQ